jgi:hypothetical protein
MEDIILPGVPTLISPSVSQIPAYDFDVALIIDGTVFQIMNIDGQTAAQFLSNPTFVQVANGSAKIGWTYQDGVFSPPTNLPGL